MYRAILSALLLLTLVGTTQAQELERPDGWGVRFDNADASEADLEMFVAMPPGWHVTSGPAAIYWDPASSAEGDYALEMEVYLFDPGQRREAFGLFFGGSALEGPDQGYGYFLIRNGGEFIVKTRSGADAPTVVPWTQHDAILSFSQKGEDEASVLNVLGVRAEGDQVSFLVNGTTVHTMDRGDLPTDGTFGMRVNHGLNLHISRLERVSGS